ncbi:4-(cytidine 5'-diphospho)-2-C-methyl-D-erythritol kinase [Mariprofundus erugo]|uniref:4-(cytidine 5'-diphospho)-2-C-methyl-D-erythritol kinase n=1 Tax=Mariprofundus erugo TaxID=2528639 RepID=UPI0010FE118A|nr:4-(cytidine 5'-diphospho)-2-C-methyl-D-erythritol kinase [Mariprofundus erugo]TLS76020.1 4-(cytidine 5'-diphospho)-2-C-methyl-D-erythritol kinase [Mariprofundus erugo]
MTLTLPAPAKINLYLSVTRIRDDGMHDLDTAFAFSQACDTLHFQAAETISVTCSRPHLGGEANLVHRVLSALRDRHNIRQGLSVHIEKSIPEQAGLGGGSSDAATALLAANKLWQTGLTREELIAFATPFGADIPCFLYGQASIASGVGDRLHPYPDPLPDTTMLLAWPGSGLSTARVFEHFDRTHPALTTHQGVDTMRAGIHQMGHNDLEEAACSMNKSMACLLEELRNCSDIAWMSGSGSACIALFQQAEQACETAQVLQARQLAGWTHTGSICSTHPVQL